MRPGRRCYRRARNRRFRLLKDDERGPDLDLISRADLAFIHALTVHECARFIPQVDQRNVLNPSYLDDGVHSRRQIVVHA
jgi:hypothetical protein